MKVSGCGGRLRDEERAFQGVDIRASVVCRGRLCTVPREELKIKRIGSPEAGREHSLFNQAHSLWFLPYLLLLKEIPMGRVK